MQNPTFLYISSVFQFICMTSFYVFTLYITLWMPNVSLQRFNLFICPFTKGVFVHGRPSQILVWSLSKLFLFLFGPCQSYMCFSLTRNGNNEVSGIWQFILSLTFQQILVYTFGHSSFNAQDCCNWCCLYGYVKACMAFVIST